MRRRHDHSRGFSLTEILIVLGLGMILFVASNFANLSDLGASERQAHTDTAVDALLLARSRAQSGMCIEKGCTHGQAYGVHMNAYEITVFEGESYGQRFFGADLSFETPSPEFSASEEIIFFSGSGKSSIVSSFDLGTSSIYRLQVSKDGGIDVAPNP